MSDKAPAGSTGSRPVLSSSKEQACAPPDFRPRRPRWTLPAGACDCHAHILGPGARYPYSAQRVYTPPDCLLPDYLRMLGALGLERAVLVQPSVYGADNTVLLEALKQACSFDELRTGREPVESACREPVEPAGTRFRGVAVVSSDVADAELERLDEQGVRGVRVNIVDVKDRKPGTFPAQSLRALAERIAPLGWHLELLLHVDEFPGLDRMFADFPVDLVLGHLGYMHTGGGLEAPGFQALLRLLRAGRCWVKLTGPYRISGAALPYPDVTPLARALAQAAPDRLVWGSDWPHVMLKGAMPNDAELFDLLADWLPEEPLRRRVLVDNPARLYRF